MWRRLFARRRMQEELDEEIRAHVAMAARDRMERGESAEEADKAVRRELGNELLIKEVTSDIWGWAAADRMLRDLKYVLRQMRRNPGFTAVAILTLAMGLGATTAMFSIVNGVLLEPLKYRDPGRLYVGLNISPPGASVDRNWPVNARQFSEWRRRCESCEQVAMAEGRGYTLTGVGEPERLPGLRVSYNFFRTLGVEPARGRDFAPEEEMPGRANEALLSDALWRSRFGGDPNIVGKVIQLDSEPNTVIGVMPADLTLPVGSQWGTNFANPLPPVIFRPLGMDASQAAPFGMNNYVSAVRLKPGAGPKQAVAEMNAIVAELARENHIPNFDNAIKPALFPMQQTITGGAREELWLLLATVGAVLLIVCVNVGNLMLVRTASRDREAGIRMALGASRGELFGLVVKEAAILAAGGAALGLFLAYAGLKAFVAAAPVNLPRIGDVHMDGRVLLFGFAAAMLATLVCGAVPAWRLARTEPQESLKLGAANASSHGSKLRFRELMVSVEVALSAALLIVGGLLMLSFFRLVGVDKGFEAAHVITQDTSLIGGKYREDPPRTQFIDVALRRLAAIPGVDAAGVTSQVPLRGETWIDGLRDATKPELPEPTLANFRFVSADYWRAMGIPLKRGRFFEESDRNRSVAVLSERAAKLLWPNEDPIGKQVHLTGGMQNEVGEVVGVVGDARATLEHESPLIVYEPYWVMGIGGPSFVVRTRADATAVMGEVRGVLRSLDSGLPLAQTKTMEQILDESVAARRFQMDLAVVFAAAALLLASLGVYGVISFTVARRTPELGIRIALGARTAEVVRMVLRQGMAPVIVGVVAGLFAALAIGRLLASQLYGVTARDPMVFAIVATALLGIAVCACLAPARRAARIDPVTALRSE